MKMNEQSIPAGLEFAPAELQAMHKFCLQYRDTVRGGGRPSLYQDVHFMLYQRFTYAAGVAHE